MLSNTNDTALPPLNYYHPTTSSYVLPPPSSLPGFHLPPPPEKKRKRRQPKKQYQVMELKKQKRKGSEAAMSAAAATLASFSKETECIQLESCAGQGGEYKCEHCGYDFKHLNCLQRHGWDHTSNMSKQQKTQLLEAAEILMKMASIKTI